MKCPKCSATVKQNKIGKTSAGSQRYRCFVCQCKHTPEKKPRVHSPELRKEALRLYVDGMNLSRIARHLGIHHHTISDQVKAYAENLPATPMPEKVKIAEMDELFTFIGDKKQNLLNPHRRSGHTLRSGMEIGLGAHKRVDPDSRE